MAVNQDLGGENQKILDLIQKAQEGNESAFGQIYDLYYEKIYRFVFFRTNHRETAEDIVAETFIKSWKNLKTLHDNRTFNGWIFQIARNLVVDFYRAKKEVINLDTLENDLVCDENIIDKANFTVDQDRFWQAVKTLSPDQQTVLEMKYLEDMDNREISVLLNKTEGAIRVIHHRALSQLKNFFKDA